MNLYYTVEHFIGLFVHMAFIFTSSKHLWQKSKSLNSPRIKWLSFQNPNMMCIFSIAPLMSPLSGVEIVDQEVLEMNKISLTMRAN